MNRIVPVRLSVEGTPPRSFASRATAGLERDDAGENRDHADGRVQERVAREHEAREEVLHLEVAGVEHDGGLDHLQQQPLHLVAVHPEPGKDMKQQGNQETDAEDCRRKDVAPEQQKKQPTDQQGKQQAEQPGRSLANEVCEPVNNPVHCLPFKADTLTCILSVKASRTDTQTRSPAKRPFSMSTSSRSIRATVTFLR